MLYFDQIDARLISLKQAQRNTCRWILKTSQYRNWTDSAQAIDWNHAAFFWIKGKPGTGKSITMKFLFSEAKRTAKSKNTLLISFFFNARGNELERSTVGLYRSLLLQLLQKVPDLESVVDHWGTLGLNSIKQSGWTREMLQEGFSLAVDRLKNVNLCCYIDALDECPEDDVRDMVSFLEDLSSKERSIKFRICFSSRHYPEIGIKTTIQLVLEDEQEHTEDISVYIEAHLKIGNSTQREDIKNEIVRKSSNIFLWVHLVVPLLNKEYDRGRIKGLKQRLNDIPIGLHELFVDILTRDCNNVEDLCLCIQFILFAKRPLSPGELRAATLLAADEVIDESFYSDEMTSEDLRKVILDLSKGLAEITKTKTPTVQFIHESVRDFFLKEGGLDKLPMGHHHNLEGRSHANLARVCLFQLRAVSRFIHPTVALAPDGAKWNIPNGSDFLQYAIGYTIHHANMAQRYEISQRQFANDFPFQEWKALRNGLEKAKSRHYDETTSLLYALAEYGAESLISTHPEKQKHFQIVGGRFSLPLFAAIFVGENIITVLTCSLAREYFRFCLSGEFNWL